eukprot:maker-scaffold_3-snap-gene-3.10-mRNA-1 protein AED:0.00 eAED:0.00 QI:84/1/1/1/1/1/2/135/289
MLKKISFVCDSPATVAASKGLFETIFNVLGQEVNISKALSTSSKHVHSTTLQVQDAEIEFFSSTRVEKIRKFLNLPPFCLISNIYIEAKSSVTRPSNSKDFSPSLYLTELPNLFSKVSILKPSNTALNTKSANLLKEVVVGTTESDASLIREFSLNGIPQGKLLNTFVLANSTIRAIPSLSSCLVLYSQEEYIETMTSELVSGGFKVSEIGKLRQEDIKVDIPSVSGLDLRISSCRELNGYFYEAPTDNSTDFVTFNRQDMGGMSCNSVVAMEAKARFFKLPQQVISKL